MRKCPNCVPHLFSNPKVDLFGVCRVWSSFNFMVPMYLSETCGLNAVYSACASAYHPVMQELATKNRVLDGYDRFINLLRDSGTGWKDKRPLARSIQAACFQG